jgi:lipoyl(octanoyl) transferase
MRYLEEAVIQTCAEFGIESTRIDGLTGVWLTNPPRKICAMGVKASRWVTMHGLALNVCPDLSYFGNIVPCGIDDKAVTSIEKEIDRKVEIIEVNKLLKQNLAKVFEMEIL